MLLVSTSPVYKLASCTSSYEDINTVVNSWSQPCYRLAQRQHGGQLLVPALLPPPFAAGVCDATPCVRAGRELW